MCQLKTETPIQMLSYTVVLSGGNEDSGMDDYQRYFSLTARLILPQGMMGSEQDAVASGDHPLVRKN